MLASNYESKAKSLVFTFRCIAGREKIRTLWKAIQIHCRWEEEGAYTSLMFETLVTNGKISLETVENLFRQRSPGSLARCWAVPRHHHQMLHLQQPASLLAAGLQHPQPGSVDLRVASSANFLAVHKRHCETEADVDAASVFFRYADWLTSVHRCAKIRPHSSHFVGCFPTRT